MLPVGVLYMLVCASVSFYRWYTIKLRTWTPFHILVTLLIPDSQTIETYYSGVIPLQHKQIMLCAFLRKLRFVTCNFSNSSPLNHHFSWTVQSWVEDLPLQPGVLHRQPLRTFAEECIDLLTYLLTNKVV